MPRTKYEGRKWLQLIDCYELVRDRWNQKADAITSFPAGADKVKVEVDFPDGRKEVHYYMKGVGEMEATEGGSLVPQNQVLYKEPEGQFDKGVRTLCRSLTELETVLTYLIDHPEVVWALDVETGWPKDAVYKSSVNPVFAQAVGFSIAYRDAGTIRSWYVPVRHWVGNNVEGAFESPLLNTVLVENPPIVFMAIFDIREMWKNGLIRACRRDVMHMLSMLGGRREALKDVSERLLKAGVVKLKDLFDPDTHHFGMFDPETTGIYKYGCDDVVYTIALDELFMARPVWDDQMLSILEMERDLAIGPYMEMEYEGLNIDTEVVYQTAEIYRARRDELYEKFFKMAEELVGPVERFKLHSPKALASLLFDKIGMQPVIHTDSGAPSVSTEALEALPPSELLEVLAEYKSVRTVLETYLERIGDYLDPQSKIHWSFEQIGQSGRTYTFGPNVQQQPPEVRKAAVPPPGHFFLSADYKAQELRVMAALSQDPFLTGLFKEGRDPHIWVYSMMVGKPPEQVTDAEREYGKVLNFGSIYGMEAETLSHRLRISREVAERLLARYFEVLAGVARHKKMVVQQAKARGGVRTYFGRWREISNITSSNRYDRGVAERQAVNTEIQGTAADVTKRAIRRLYRGLPDDVKMKVPVHDSVLFSVPLYYKDAGKLPELKALIRKLMEEEIQGVKMEVSFKEGRNWGEMEKSES